MREGLLTRFFNIRKLLLYAVKRRRALGALCFDTAADGDFVVNIHVKLIGEGFEFLHGHFFNGNSFIDAVQDNSSDDFVTVTERNSFCHYTYIY